MIAAAALAALAAAVAIGPERRVAAGARAARRGGLPARSRMVAIAAVGAAAAALLVAPRWAGWLLTVGVIAGTVLHLGAAGRRRRAQEAGAADCAAATRALAGLLRAGQLPAAALDNAAEEFPLLRPAAAAARLGTDVAGQLSRSSDAPGYEGLTMVAAAWRLSEQTGAPVAEVLGRVAEDLRGRRRVAAVVETELAAARTTGRIMGALPIAALLLGAMSGVDTMDILIGRPWGQWLVLGGAVLAAGGVLWVDRLAGRGVR